MSSPPPGKKSAVPFWNSTRFGSHGSPGMGPLQMERARCIIWHSGGIKGDGGKGTREHKLAGPCPRRLTYLKFGQRKRGGKQKQQGGCVIRIYCFPRSYCLAVAGLPPPPQESMLLGSARQDCPFFFCSRKGLRFSSRCINSLSKTRMDGSGKRQNQNKTHQLPKNLENIQREEEGGGEERGTDPQ